MYLTISSIFLFVIMVKLFNSMDGSYAQIQRDVLIDRGDVENGILYLSDIPYSKAQVGWAI